MTTLIQRLRDDVKAALRAKDGQKRTALSTLTSEAARHGLDDGKRDSTDAEVLDTIREFIKNGAKTLASLGTANPELRAKTEYELALFATYLPKQATEADVRAAVNTIVDGMPQDQRIMKNMGTVMGKLNAQFGDDFDKTLASKLVKEVLSAKPAPATPAV